jgi:hypothetical protein
MKEDDTIYGFKFKHEPEKGIHYYPFMDCYARRVGVISTIYDTQDKLTIRFKDDMTILYPLNKSRKYLATSRNILIEKIKEIPFIGIEMP